MEDKQDYYVYVHRRKDTGEVFYIGSGRQRRAYVGGKTKTSNWGIVNGESGGHIVEIIHDKLTKSCADELEASYIKNPPHGWNLVNIRLPVKTIELSYDELNYLFEYSENSPSGLVWKNSKFNSKNGKPAGGLQNTGMGKKYWVVRKNNRLFLIHRVVYVLVTGQEIPHGFVIDHLDGDGLNNNFSNLRCVSQIENSINSKKKESSTGEKFIVVGENNIIFRIDNEFHGKITRKYSLRKYGYCEALRLAIEAREEFLSKFNENNKR